MCRQRIAVEWGFAKLKNLFKMLTFKVVFLLLIKLRHFVFLNLFQSNLKVRLSPVAMYFFVAVHLMNLHTCFYGSQVFKFIN